MSAQPPHCILGIIQYAASYGENIEKLCYTFNTGHTMQKLVLTFVIVALIAMLSLGGYMVQQIVDQAVPDTVMIKYILALLGVGGVFVYTLVDSIDPLGWYHQLKNEEF